VGEIHGETDQNLGFRAILVLDEQIFYQSLWQKIGVSIRQNQTKPGPLWVIGKQKPPWSLKAASWM